MRNFASTLVKFSKLSHIQTTIWRPPKMAPPPPPPPPPHCGVSGALCYATDYVGLALTALEKDSQANYAPLSKNTLDNRRVQLPEEDFRWAKITALEEFGIDMEDYGVINLPNSWQSLYQ